MKYTTNKKQKYYLKLKKKYRDDDDDLNIFLNYITDACDDSPNGRLDTYDTAETNDYQTKFTIKDLNKLHVDLSKFKLIKVEDL